MKFTDALIQINEGTAWKDRKTAQAYCDTMKDVYGVECHPVQVDKDWDYWEVEYKNQNKLTEEVLNEESPAEKVAKVALDSLVVSLNDSVDSAVDDIANNIVGPKTKEIVADELRESLKNFSKDIEDSEEFITSIVEQLEDELKKNLTESFKVNVKKDALDGLSDLVNKEVIKIQFKDEDKQFASDV